MRFHCYDKIFQRIRDLWPILLIIGLELILFFTNYIPDTFLLGWDNLFPEKNIAVNLERSIFSIWQEYRGLGILDGMAHSANLIHTLWIWLLSLLFPINTLRYMTNILLHAVGGIGMYFLLLELFKHKDKLLCLVGALFYLFNIATIQMFFTPLEVFSFHFAFLPWLIYCLYSYILVGGGKNLIKFIFFLLISTPQAFVPSVFIVYFIAFVAITLSLFKVNKKRILRIFSAYLFVFILNAYWGLPYIYSAFHASDTIVNSKINQMSTDNVVDRNKEFGNLENVILMKGFSFNYVDYQKNGENGYMLLAWRNQMEKFLVKTIGYIYFIFALSGLIFIIRTKKVIYYPYAFLFIFSFLMLGSDIPGLSLFTDVLQKNIPYFYNIFRFAFTKFSILYCFAFTVLLILGLNDNLSFFRNKKIRSFLTALTAVFIFIYAYPVFSGNFFYENLKVKIPDEYNQLVAYFKNQDKNTRIAFLPQYSYWGWTYYGWGFRGSGFLWYALPQATLDGAFYPWSRENENYYWEITQAIYSQDKNLFLNLLDKYQISWLLVDGNIISPPSPRALYLEQVKKLIDGSGKVILEKEIGNIKIYRVLLEANPKDYVFLVNNLPLIEPSYNWNNRDQGYLEYGNYITDKISIKLRASNRHLTINNSENNEIYYPFRSLFTGRKQEELEFDVENVSVKQGFNGQEEEFIFKVKIPKELVGAKLVVPKLIDDEISEIDSKDLSQVNKKYPQIFLDEEVLNFNYSVSSEIPLPYITDGNLEVRVPKIWGYYSAKMDPKTYSLESSSCDPFNKGTMNRKIRYIENSPLVRFTSVGSSNCLDFDLPRLTQKLGYLVTLENKNIEGKSLLFSVINKNSQRIDLETYLPKFNEPKEVQPPGRLNLPRMSYFIIPPMEEFGQGYTLHFDNISIGRTQTVNDLGQITVNPIPYRFLTSLKLVKDRNFNQQPTTNNQQLSVFHPNPSFYEIQIANNQLPGTNSQYLILSQSFDNGWHAYEITNDWLIDSWYMKLLIPIFGKEIKDHVLINNWENGWKISNQLSAVSSQKPVTIVLIYLPQYLEYLGFGLMGISFIYLLMTRQTKTGARD